MRERRRRQRDGGVPGRGGAADPGHGAARRRGGAGDIRDGGFAHGQRALLQGRGETHPARRLTAPGQGIDRRVDIGIEAGEDGGGGAARGIRRGNRRRAARRNRVRRRGGHGGRRQIG